MGYKKLLILAAASTLIVTGCFKKNSSNQDGGKTYTLNRFTTVSPSNWNQLTYSDANDTQIMSFLGSSFFEFNFEFDSNGEIVDGGFAVDYSAATALKDVTANYKGQYGVPADAAKAYAYEIELRNDLKWDDGSAITAADFVYSMKQQLDPLFQNYRASSFYQNNIVIHGAKDYVFQGSHAYSNTLIDEDYSDDAYVPMDQFYVNTNKPFKDGRAEIYGFNDADGNFHDLALKLNDGGVWSSHGFDYYYDYYIANGVYYQGHYGYFTMGYDETEDGLTQFYKIGDAEEKVVLLLQYDEEDNLVGAFDVASGERVALTINALEDGSDIEFKNAAGEVVYTRKSCAPVMLNYPAAERLFKEGKANTKEGQVGYVILDTQAKVKDLQDATAFLHGYDDADAYYADKGDYGYLEWQEWVYVGEDLPVYDWANVGITANGNKLTLILDKALALLNDDGTLNYRAAYMLGDLPLVKESLFEANKVAPKTGATLWTSTYNSSAESTASWGPYRLASFQVDKQYVLERNPNWYGYNMDQYKGQYQTDRIVCDTVPKWETAWLMFQQGDLSTIGIDPSIADEYKASARAVYTPGDSVWSFQIQSNEEALKGRETAGVDKEIIANQKFRKALSLGFNRAEYASTCFTADLPSLSLFTELHYYDVETGGKYIASTAWKEMICRFYNVDVSKFASLDEAVNSITGYDLAQARQLLTEAYNEQVAAGKFNEGDKVVITVGVSTYSTTYQRIVKYLTESWTNLAKTTPLEGKIEVEVKEFGSTWSKEFKDNGSYDLIPAAGWTGSAWDIPGLMDAYLNPEYMYSKAWDTDHVMLKLTVNGEELEYSIREWNNCLMGEADAPKNFGEGFLDVDERLKIIAAIEEVVLETAYSVPTVSDYSAALLSFKVEYITRKYNTFMGYGGVRYMTYNYDDAAWEAIKGTLADNYKL